MTEPATRPCLLAWVPSATWIASPVSRWTVCAQSPAANTSGCERLRWVCADVDRAGDAELQPGLAGERDLRAHAQPEDDEVGVVAARRRCARPAPTPSASTSISRTGWPVCTSMPMSHMAAQTRSPMSSSSWAIGSGSARTTVTSQPAGLQHLGHLQADVAAAQHDGPLRPGRDRGADVGAVGQPVHPVHAVGVQAGHLRAHRPAAGGDDEVVVAEPLAAGGDDLPGGEVDALGAGVGAHDDVLLGELLRGARDQPVAVGDQAADPVRDAAGGVGDLRPLLEDDDLQIAPPGAAAGPARPPTTPRRPRR